MTTRPAAYALFAGDHASVDGVETVTFTPVTGAAVTTVKAKRLGPEKSTIPVANQFGHQPAQMQWRLWDETLGGNEPHSECKITDEDGEIYTILQASKQLFGTQWDCNCIRQIS